MAKFRIGGFENELWPEAFLTVVDPRRVFISDTELGQMGTYKIQNGTLVFPDGKSAEPMEDTEIEVVDPGRMTFRIIF